MPASTPDRFGAYTICYREDGSAWELGRGAMGVTYRAIDESLDRPVALKVIHTTLRGRGREVRERFMREARAAAALRHPNVATVYQFGIREETGQCFYAMELVEGETLEERVARLGPLNVLQTSEAALQVCGALEAAEKRGLVHRDLKPANIMVLAGDEGVAPTYKVIDFGVAKAVAEKTNPMMLTRGGFVGTPAFASPEQFTNAAVDGRSDIFSLGATMWFLLTGRMPFAGGTVEEISAAQRSTALRVHQLKAARVPARLVMLMSSMLALEPAARPAGARELAQRLRECAPQTGKARWPLAVAAAVVLVAIGSIVTFVHPFGASADRTAAVAAEKSVAVLPFENLTQDPANASLASGIHADVLANLSKVADLKVISRNSVMQYRAVGRDLREIGRALGVKAVLEGSVRREGNRARVNVQLINAAEGAQIWAENYDRDISDTFAIQAEVALKTAAALKANLSALEAARVQQRPTKNSEAYLRFVEAKNLYLDYRKQRADLDKAEQLYEEAIRLDPGFALAYARLSQLENMYYTVHDQNPARREKARAAAREALRLQPDLPEGHMAVALDYWRPNASTGEIDYASALGEFAIAQRGLPNDAELCGLIGQVERHQGKWTESTEHFKRAVALDPNSIERWDRLFYNYELTRNYAAAAEALDRVIALAPVAWKYQWHRGFLQLFWKGDLSVLQQMPDPPRDDPEWPHTEERLLIKMFVRKYDEAEKVLLEDPREIFTWAYMRGLPKSAALGQIYARKNEPVKAHQYFEAARPILERAVAERPLAVDPHLSLADLYAQMGRKDDAIREAKRATEIIPESKDKFDGLGVLIDLARIYVLVGETDLALPIIEHALATPAGLHVNDMRVDPAWDNIQSDPRFQKLLDRYGSAGTATSTMVEKSVAVLPFNTLSEDPANAFFASGVQDEVLVNLSKIRDLRVISRNSVLLGVAYVLEGDVRHQGTRARLNVQLVKASSDEQLWAETYDREMSDVFALQSDLALQITSALKANLTSNETTELQKKPTENGKAYLVYMQANEIFGSYGRSQADAERAVQLYEQAIALDPAFALAYAKLSQVETVFHSLYGFDPARREKARTLALKALELQPDLAEAHKALAIYYYKGESRTAPAISRKDARS